MSDGILGKFLIENRNRALAPKLFFGAGKYFPRKLKFGTGDINSGMSSDFITNDAVKMLYELIAIVSSIRPRSGNHANGRRSGPITLWRSRSAPSFNL